jgi:hypothetical protein
MIFLKRLLLLIISGHTISCNGTERNGTKRNETKRIDFVSCFSNYYRDITILRNETIPFRFVPFRIVSEFLRFASCFSNFL